MRYDGIIIGSGPSGSQVAYRLASRGYHVAVLEQKPEAGGKLCCTGIIGVECANVFSIDPTVILRQVSSARISAPSGTEIRVARDEPQAVVLDRTAFDRHLARRAQETGADFFFHSAVADIQIEREKVSIRTTGQTFEAKVAVIAPGFNPRLVEKLGMGTWADFVAGAQAEVSTNEMDEIEVYLGREIAPGFFAWLVPTAPGRARVGLLTRQSPGTYLKKLLASLKARGKIDAAADVELHHGGIPLKPAPRTYGERVIIVGDAAGQVKPTTGGGIYYGMLGADFAAETIHRAFQSGDFSAEGLAGYERAWQKKMGQELRTGYQARKLFERLSDEWINHIFSYVKRRGIMERLAQMNDLSFDWHGEALLALLRSIGMGGVISIALPLRRLRKN